MPNSVDWRLQTETRVHGRRLAASQTAFEFGEQRQNHRNRPFDPATRPEWPCRRLGPNRPHRYARTGNAHDPAEHRMKGSPLRHILEGCSEPLPTESKV